ncbi:MAG: chorismate-binding protein [Spirochaetota bacterium]
MIRPSLADFLKNARSGLIVAIVREMPADRMTPIDAFYALGASYLLESAEGGSLGRYSFLGVEPVARLTVNGNSCRMEEGGWVESFVTTDPLRAVGDLVDSRRYFGEGDLSPFPGGAVGYLGYDAARLWERLPLPPGKVGPGVPDAIFIVTRFTLVFDNLTHSLKVICNARIGEDPGHDYSEAVKGIDRIVQELERADFDRSRPTVRVRAGKPEPEGPREDFEAAVVEAKELLAAGEAIQVVLSRRFSAGYEGDPFAVYRALRSINPSPYMFYLDFGDFVLLGASPEIMVRVAGGKAVLRPIAGTRPRGKDGEEDARLRTELLADEKERAEHLMLVDLARNDLGRVAAPGKVRVDRMMEVEMYSHVMHIVSEVSADLAEGVDVADVVRAVFPAGTVSGAPKIRAMEIIDSLEPSLRGPYGGLIGYFSYRGGFDSCIAIRSALFKDGRAHVQAGAGIVHDSQPDKEYDEVRNKAKAMFVALERAEATNGPAR